MQLLLLHPAGQPSYSHSSPFLFPSPLPASPQGPKATGTQPAGEAALGAQGVLKPRNRWLRLEEAGRSDCDLHWGRLGKAAAPRKA